MPKRQGEKGIEIGRLEITVLRWVPFLSGERFLLGRRRTDRGHGHDPVLRRRTPFFLFHILSRPIKNDFLGGVKKKKKTGNGEAWRVLNRLEEEVFFQGLVGFRNFEKLKNWGENV